MDDVAVKGTSRMTFDCRLDSKYFLLLLHSFPRIFRAFHHKPSLGATPPPK